MRKILFRKVRGIIGIIIVIVSMSLVYTWEVKGRESFLYTDVVVLNTDVKEGQIITKDMLSFVSMDTTKLIENVIVDPRLIINKAARHYIPKGTQLIEEYFDSPELVLNENEYIFKIPEQWILSMPNTIRRKDTAYFYAVHVSNLPKDKDIDFDSLYEYMSKNPVASFTVAYVKDTSNKEVTNTDHERNSTSRIASLEVITDEERIDILKKYAENGNKFIIVYK